MFVYIYTVIISYRSLYMNQLPEKKIVNFYDNVRI